MGVGLEVYAFIRLGLYKRINKFTKRMNKLLNS